MEPWNAFKHKPYLLPESIGYHEKVGEEISKMRKLIYLSLVVFLSLLPSVYAEECLQHRVNFHIDVEAISEGVLSEYQFNEFREGDVLFIRDIRVVNLGSCIFPSSNVTFKISSKSSLKYGEKIKLPSIEPGETLELSRYGRTNQYNFYRYSRPSNKTLVDGEVRYIRGTHLNETGKWHIDADLEAPYPPVKSLASSFLLNDGFNFEFYVLSNYELETRDLARATRDLAAANANLALWTMRFTWALLLFTFFLIIIAIRSDFKNRESMNRLIEIQEQSLDYQRRLLKANEEIKKSLEKSKENKKKKVK